MAQSKACKTQAMIAIARLVGAMFLIQFLSHVFQKYSNSNIHAISTF
jgi:hypothetical protein